VKVMEFVANIDHLIYQHFDQLHSPIERQQMQFEFILFFYMVSHLLIQNFNIYRTNFYNYNFYLLFLTILILFKRILRRYWKHVKWQNPGFGPLEMSNTQIILNITIITIILTNSVYLLIQMFLHHPFINFLFLIYPLIAYFLLFGINNSKKKKMKYQMEILNIKNTIHMIIVTIIWIIIISKKDCFIDLKN